MNKYQEALSRIISFMNEQGCAGIFSKYYNGSAEDVLEELIEKAEQLEKALDMACEILSHDMQKIDINGDEKLVFSKAEEWKEYLLNENN